MKTSIGLVLLAFVFLAVLVSGCAPAPVPPTDTVPPPTFTTEPTSTSIAPTNTLSPPTLDLAWLLTADEINSISDSIGVVQWELIDPWVSFTSFNHPMQLHPADSIPRFAWGKYFTESDTLKMPLSVQGHHAVMDGIHMGRFYETVQDYLHYPEVVLGAV